jgi:hypothetical protein
MIRNEGIAMADEQNQGNTIINQGTTIDNLPGLDGMTPTQKQAFIDSAFVPIRGTISGEMSTRKVTGSDLAASGENRIESISVNRTPIEPDAHKNVNITIPDPVTADNETIEEGENGLRVVNPLPPNDTERRQLLGADGGSPDWFELGVGLQFEGDNTIGIAYGGGTGGLAYTPDYPKELYVKLDQETLGLNSNDQITVRHDDTLKQNYDNPYDGELSVAVPVPDPLDARLPADNGSILTYDEDDGVIWNSTTDFFNNNTDLEIFNVNNGQLSLNWDLIDGSGGLCVFHNSRDTLGVALHDAGGINMSSNGDLYVGTDNTLVTHEKVGTNDTYLSVAVPVPDPEEHNAEEGDVLTFDGTDVVWDAPAFTLPTADNYDNYKVLTVTVDNQGNPSYHWDRRVQYVYAGLGLRETSSSAADVQATLAIDTYNAHDGDVMCYDSSKDPEVFWSDRITLLEARVAALEDALNGNQFSVNGNTPTVNGYTPTINQ